MNKKWHKYLDLHSVLFGKIYLNIPFKDKDEFIYTHNGMFLKIIKIWKI